MRALVVGGTAATGPPIVRRLLQRGYDVTLYHRGLHEVDDLPDDLEHIHGEPHFEEPIARDLAGRSFDLVVATYGRIRHLAKALEGKTPRLITIGGFPGMTTPFGTFQAGSVVSEPRKPSSAGMAHDPAATDGPAGVATGTVRR